MWRKSESELYHNVIQKTYPDGTARLLISDRRAFREPGFEPCVPDEARCPRAESERKPEDKERAMRRARAAVYDLARSNDFRYFVTLTLNREVIDRYDISEVMRRLKDWLGNAVQRKGLLYVLVPELHKDGAIHFHGLINDVLPMSDSGTIRRPGDKKPRHPRSKKQRSEWLENGGQVVYNLSTYSLGFSSAIELYGDYRAAIGYVCKYIGKGKDMVKIGGRWYYSGGQLRRPSRSYYDVDLDLLSDFVDGEHSFTIPRMGIKCWSIETEV